MPNLDLKSPAAQRLVLIVLLAGGVLGVYFGSHLLPWTFPSTQDRLAETQAQYEQKSAELARARASVSLSHKPSCTCDTCKAAQGDEEAFLRVYEAVFADPQDQPGSRGRASGGEGR